MYHSFEDIKRDVRIESLPIWKIIQKEDCREREVTEEQSYEQMKHMYIAMREADDAYDASLQSRSKLSGGDGDKVQKAREAGDILCGNLIGCVMEKAIKMGESNACMKRIVAAPTAGSCGVVPAVLLTLEEQLKFSEEDMVQAMYVVAGIGGVISHRASLSGAAGGCQAEIGSASSMVAGAIAFLRGGTVEQIESAAAFAMKNLLGLACDPVAGLVEVPCIKRNVMGAVNALTSADLALAGVSSRIPLDEVYDAMRQIGRSMPEEIRETGKGGLAATVTGKEIAEKLAITD